MGGSEPGLRLVWAASLRGSPGEALPSPPGLCCPQHHTLSTSQ